MSDERVLLLAEIEDIFHRFFSDHMNDLRRISSDVVANGINAVVLFEKSSRAL